MVQFGGTFIPVHFVGFLVEEISHLEEQVWATAWAWVMAGARPSAVLATPEILMTIGLGWPTYMPGRPDSYGLQTGVSVYRDKITLSNGRSVPRMDQRRSFSVD
jgi:hypothetical protein